jgi:hypothetical protein
LDIAALRQLEKEMEAVSIQYRYCIHYGLKGRFHTQKSLRRLTSHACAGTLMRPPSTGNLLSIRTIHH